MHDLPGTDFVPSPPEVVTISTPKELEACEQNIARERQAMLTKANAESPVYLTRDGNDLNLWRFAATTSYCLVPSVPQQVCWRPYVKGRERVWYTNWGWVSAAEMREARRAYRTTQTK